jgi:glucosamine-6-phosphate deaminase
MEQEFKVEELEVKIYKSRQLMGLVAAKIFIEQLDLLLKTQDKVNVIFAAAPSQNEFLQVLKENKNLNWEKVNVFHMDEYIGLAQDAPQGFGNFLKEKLFDHLPFGSVNYLNGNEEDVEKECERYSNLLAQYPADIVCMGIGENGHIAFNDPPVANFNDSKMVKVVELDLECRQQQVNDGCFTSLNEVPVNALTLTIPAMMKAKFIYCMVPGERKAKAVYNTLNQEKIEKFPSTILRSHPNAILFLDKDSSSLLKAQV